MESTITIAALIIVIIFLLLFIYLQNKQFSEKQSELLNRVMARNFETYVQAEVLRKPERPLTPEEIAAMQEERGIPV
jgi:hypothetical protein